MKTTINAVKHFILSEDGPTAVEYAVTAALVIIAAIAGISALGTGLNTWFDATGTYVGELGPTTP
ncbi:MAG: Flp family type IVb pilin [bacterium]